MNDSFSSESRILHGLMQLLNRVHLLHRIRLYNAGSKNGLYPGQPPVLEYIWQHPGCTQKQVADFLRVSSPSIATSVKRMQKAGLLEKETDPENLRCSRLTITELGLKQLDLCWAAFQQLDENAFRGFSQEELEALRSYLARVEENLAGEEFASKPFPVLLAAAREMDQEAGKKSFP